MKLQTAATTTRDQIEEDERLFRTSILASISQLSERAVILSSLTERSFIEIGNGILFVHAPWAGQSMRALQAICRMLYEKEFATIQLWIVDIAMVDLPRDFYGEIKFGGYGETFWIKDGHARKVGSNYSAADLNEIRAITYEVLHDK